MDGTISLIPELGPGADFLNLMSRKLRVGRSSWPRGPQLTGHNPTAARKIAALASAKDDFPDDPAFDKFLSENRGKVVLGSISREALEDDAESVQ
jgi:hypothetical protein